MFVFRLIWITTSNITEQILIGPYNWCTLRGTIQHRDTKHRAPETLGLVCVVKLIQVVRTTPLTSDCRNRSDVQPIRVMLSDVFGKSKSSFRNGAIRASRTRLFNQDICFLGAKAV